MTLTPTLTMYLSNINRGRAHCPAHVSKQPHEWWTGQNDISVVPVAVDDQAAA